MSQTGLEIYTTKSLSSEEAKVVESFEERGRPGVVRLRVDFLQSVYNLGYSCQEINSQMPEYPLDALLWARWKYDWDKKRDDYQASVQNRVLPNATHARVDGLQFLSEIMGATHAMWRQQLLKYLAAPDREKAPEFLPKTLHQYSSLAALMKDLMTPDNKTAGAGSMAQPLVSVNISGDSRTVEVRAGDVKDALKKSLGKDKK